MNDILRGFDENRFQICLYLRYVRQYRISLFFLLKHVLLCLDSNGSFNDNGSFCKHNFSDHRLQRRQSQRSTMPRVMSNNKKKIPVKKTIIIIQNWSVVRSWYTHDSSSLRVTTNRWRISVAPLWRRRGVHSFHGGRDFVTVVVNHRFLL